MGKFKNWLVVWASALVLAACGGGSDDTLNTPGGGPVGGPQTPAASTVTLITSSPSIPSDGAANATITALVRDASNNVIEGAAVNFTADSGSLVVNETTTDTNGQATATLSTAGDKQNRTITVSAAEPVSGITATIAVDVIGTTLSLSGPANLAQSDSGTFNAVLKDAGGLGIGGVDITLASSAGNTLNPTTATTDAQGLASFGYTADSGGTDTLTADGLGISASTDVVVSSDAFTFNDPAPNTEVTLGATQTVTVNWQQNGTPVVGQAVTFATTRGTATPLGGGLTDAAGNAQANVTANNAGPATVTATNSGGTSTQLDLEFVATIADSIELQADPFTIAPGEQTTITAIVRDPADNLVKNKVITFQLTDVTGGSLSVAQATTDSQGRAETFYTASSTTSASNGVTITATVQDTPTVNDTVAITVAQRELFIAIGTGNEVFEPNTAQYRKEWVIQVTDSQGNGVEGVNVSLNVLSEFYSKGFWVFPAGGSQWVQTITVAGCPDEDTDRDGVLDGAEDGLVNCNGILDPGEDLNNNGVLDFGEDANQSCRIEAGNIATVVDQASGTGTLVTDANGFGIVDVFYAQEFARWVTVTLEAKTSVQGTEFAESTTFALSIAASDVNNEQVAPPGAISPFGQSVTCADTL